MARPPGAFGPRLLRAVRGRWSPALRSVRGRWSPALRWMALLAALGVGGIARAGDLGVEYSIAAPSRLLDVEGFDDRLTGEFANARATDDVATRVLRALAAEPPVAYVAGSPTSLQARMFAADFRTGTSGGLGTLPAGGIVPSPFRIEAGGGIDEAQGFDVYIVEASLRRSSGMRERSAIRREVPVTITSNGGARSGMASGAFGVRAMPTAWWSFTQAARIGGVDAADVGGLAVLCSGTLTSHLRVPVGPLAIGMGNMGGVAMSAPGMEVVGYPLDYDLISLVTRNGLYLEGSLGTALGWRLFATDVRFFGDDLAMDSYQEVGTTVAAAGIHAGVAYLTGPDYDAFSARVGLRF